jgi:hypothetical protein
MKAMKKIFLIFTVLISQQLSAQNPKQHDAWDELLQKHVTNDGLVNYKGFISDSVKLDAYLNDLSSNSPTLTWSKNDKMAFWINAYNAFTVKLILKYYPVKSIKEIGSNFQIPFVNTPWDVKFIKIGKESLDLNKIEHKKLRKKFKDARVHFALVCASKSCPILYNKAYRASILDEQLVQQAKAFLSDKTRNNPDPSNPKVSKLFDWYGMDFKSKKVSVIDFINQYLEVKIPSNAKLDYLTYDWNLNE